MTVTSLPLGIRNTASDMIEATPTSIGGDFSLFGDIVTDVLPAVREDLKEFDVAIDNRGARTEGEKVFLVWLNMKMLNQSQYMPQFVEAPCSEAANMDIFFPEFPDADDFEQGEDSLEYKRQEILADNDMMMAKKECSTCPLRTQCLAKAVTMANSEHGAEGVWGGWGSGARGKIEGQFNNIRRDYQRGRASIEEGLVTVTKDGLVPTVKYKGMLPERIEAYEARALELLIIRN